MHRQLILIALLAGTCRAQAVGPVDEIQAGKPFVHVPLGIYVLSGPLIVPSAVVIWCDPAGTVFEAAPGAFLGVNDSLIRLHQSANVEIHNCTFKMRKADYIPPIYEISEYRHAIEMVGVNNVRLFNVTTIDAGGDGLHIAAFIGGVHSEDRKPSRNVQVERLTSKGSYRTGMAIISAEGVSVRNSTFEDTVGTSTGAGVNCEPSHGGDALKDILFEDCVSRNNAGSSFRVNMDRQTKFSKPISVTFRGCIGLEIYNGHSLIMVNQFEKPMNPVKPTGFIDFNGSKWTNP